MVKAKLFDLAIIVVELAITKMVLKAYMMTTKIAAARAHSIEAPRADLVACVVMGSNR